MATDSRATFMRAAIGASAGAGIWGTVKRLRAQAKNGYNTVEVAVEGPISREGSRLPSSSQRSIPADKIVEQIERADEDPNVEALVVKLNTPGGEVLPSEDIRLAAERFDGPTIGYATDTCASGGYWIAAGCDELWAREASVVGSIGVRGSSVNAKGLADKLGLDYRPKTAGEYKDAGYPLKEPEEQDDEYLQGLVDDYYETFVEHVAEGRGLDEETIRETEARVYLGTDAIENGLVDELGTREDVEERIEERLGHDVEIEEFTPEQSLMERIRSQSQGVAYAFGAGVADSIGVDEEFSLELR
ncbi:signal peptide peptidase SppA [Halococcus thailandensis]|uniref:Signal peptide peptidase SppA, 36K type n=1 Tax=Halococcus thailandensis JCM 13552 TaxID=1227457 RepID=M0ND53_9EURY|nr:signal peptide peptidase SppA [Halococcus thailandensis]EMA54605.1 signal peptide peptidase SppA, 36K type [Halococcus thailandensis JCM 13552]